MFFYHSKMLLHSIIFPKNISTNKAIQLSKLITDKKEVRHRKLNDWVRIGYSLPDKNKLYRSTQRKLKGLDITLVWEY